MHAIERSADPAVLTIMTPRVLYGLVEQQHEYYGTSKCERDGKGIHGFSPYI
jgi:hypothetical protein